MMQQRYVVASRREMLKVLGRKKKPVGEEIRHHHGARSDGLPQQPKVATRLPQHNIPFNHVGMAQYFMLGPSLASNTISSFPSSFGHSNLLPLVHWGC